MATKKDLTKEEKIKREFSRLKRIFKDLDKNKLQTVESLIKNAAFMAVSLEELQRSSTKRATPSNTKTAQIRAGRSKATR
ncbi:MAG: hypothetical protein ACLR1P_07595 [Oscillospiraceae bacterium]